MPRLDQSQILLQFFPEIHTTDKPEVMRRIGAMACRLVLLDLLGSYENARAAKGLGALVIRMKDGQRDADYLSAVDFEGDKMLAEEAGDTDAISFFDTILGAIDRVNPNTHALFVMVEGRGASCVLVPFEAPEAAIEAMLREVAP